MAAPLTGEQREKEENKCEFQPVMLIAESLKCELRKQVKEKQIFFNTLAQNQTTNLLL